MKTMMIKKGAVIGVSMLSLTVANTAMAQDQAAGEATATGTDAAAEMEPAGEAIVVIGSRGKARTDVDRPVPVDVVSSDALMATGQTDLGQQVQFTSPSFNSAKYGVNGTTNYADPATLKGLSPDQVLVLINGKRRHQFSSLNLNVAPGLGTIVTDLNSIPAGAIKRVEILRDGAAAQYGSDAIGGIINLALEDRVGQGTLSTTAGIHKEGDGFTLRTSLNHGFDLGADGSYFNYTLEYFSFDGTNRSDPFTGSIYPATPADYDITGPTPDFPYDTANPRADRGVYPQGPFVVGNYGSNENKTYQAFANAAYPLGEVARLYAFGGYSRKDILAFGFFRNPGRRSRAVLSVFPDGYVPELPGTSVDYSVNTGVDFDLDSGWFFDLSYGFGYNRLDLFANNTTNPSLGSATPTEFYVGRYQFSQSIFEANGSKNFGQVGFIDDLNLAFGGQYRRDNFKLFQGSPESFEVGPLALDGRDIGSSARPGIAARDENDLSRSNVGVYVDVEAELSPEFLLTTALRYENYSDFGGNLSGKLAGRYRVSDTFALRGSYNRGFRAPSLAQIGNRVNTSTVQNNQIVITQQISSDDPRLAQLGVPDPKAEISDSFNIGATADFANVLGGDMQLTIDAFQIDIKDRIAITERLSAASFPAIGALFTEAREIRFFTNQIDTQTRGVDVVLTYGTDFGDSQSLNFTLAGSYSKTEVQDQRATPSQILVGADPSVQDRLLVGQTAIELIEVAQPRLKILASATYTNGPFSANLRASHFGNVKAFSRGLSDQDPNVECEGTRCVQTFGAKTVTDLSFTYEFDDAFRLTVGSNNLFDVYPDKYNNTADGFVGQASSYANGQIPYSRNSNQFGFNGAYYYITATMNF